MSFPGALSRLVIIPLTDRCWMTITGDRAPGGPRWWKVGERWSLPRQFTTKRTDLLWWFPYVSMISPSFLFFLSYWMLKPPISMISSNNLFDHGQSPLPRSSQGLAHQAGSCSGGACGDRKDRVDQGAASASSGGWRVSWSSMIRHDDHINIYIHWHIYTDIGWCFFWVTIPNRPNKSDLWTN